MSGGRTRSNKIKEEDVNASKTVIATKKVFFLKESLLQSEKKEDWQLEYFHHPGSGKRALFLTRGAGNEILEVLQFGEPRRSWLIGSEICCDGRIYMTIPIDCTFLAIHYLRKHCTERAIALDSINDEDDPSAARLLGTFVRESDIAGVADVKTAGNSNFYKFNQKKTIAWLAVKTRRVAFALRNAGVHCGHSAKSQNYTRSEKAVADEAENDTDSLRMACDIVGRYTDMELHEELTAYLKIPSEMQAKSDEQKSNAAKRKKGEKLNGNNNKKAKTDENEDEKDMLNADAMTHAPTPVKERVLSTKEKALAKSAKGTKSISSFFKK